MSESTTPASNQLLTKRQILAVVLTASLLLPAAFLISSTLGDRFSVFEGEDEAIPTDRIKPLPVNVAELDFVESIQQTRSYTGTIRARHRSDLGFEISGKIESVSAEEGDNVVAGQILAELDTATLDAQLEATQARLNQAKSLLRELQAGPRKQTIESTRASVAAAQSLYDNAQKTLDRRKDLRNQGAISFEEYEQAMFAARTAEANLNSVQQQLAELEAGTRPERIAAQQSAVQQLESAKKEIEVAISKSKLRAPFSGTVTIRYLDQGSIARASEPVLKLVEQQHLEAWIGLPVLIAADLVKGQRHQIFVDGQPQHGAVSAKIQELDPITRTQTVLFALDSAASETVVSGQLCEIKLTSTVNESGFWIPTSALVKGVRGLWSVMVINPESSGTAFRTQKRDVEIIKTGSARVLVKGTIDDGDRVVVDGVHRIAEGQLVIPADGS